MSTELGGGGSIPIGNQSSIIIPDSEAPEKVLQVDNKINLLRETESTEIVNSYKVLSQSIDVQPGYLSDKINLNQFSIVGNKLNIFDLSGLTTDNLNQGSANLYMTESGLDDLLTNKTTDDIAEGSVNFYYTEDRFDSSIALKTTDDLDQGASNLYITQVSFDSFFNIKTSDDVSEGDSNLYYTESNFNTSLATKTADDIIAGSTNLYYTTAIGDNLTANILANHNTASGNLYHPNKGLLNTYSFSNASVLDAITKAHVHTNLSILEATTASFTAELKTQYDSLTSGSINSVVSPLHLDTGVLTHLSNDGNKHIPSNSGQAQYNILTSGTNAGSYIWEDINTIISNIAILDATPTTSTVKGVQSSYIKSHIENSISDIKHITNAQQTYIDSTVPAHLINALVHIPAFTSSDNNKFLFINSSTELAFTTSATNVNTTGQSYISASGDTITANLIDLSNTNILAGDYITISGNTISSEQRGIDISPNSGEDVKSISSSWAFSHSETYGSGSHIPTTGTSSQYIAGNGTVKDFTDAPGQIYKIILAAGGPTGDIEDRLDSSTFPSGWSGAKDTVTTDLNITHTTAKNVVDVVIYANDGTNATKLMNTAAYTTVIGNSTKTIIKIVSLATIDQPLDIYLQIE